MTAEAFWEGVRTYLALFIPFTDAGTYSFWNIARPSPGNYIFNMVPFFSPGHTLASFETLVKPWFDRLRELGIPFSPNTKQYDSYYPAYNATWGSNVILNGGGRTSAHPRP